MAGRWAARVMIVLGLGACGEPQQAYNPLDPSNNTTNNGANNPNNNAPNACDKSTDCRPGELCCQGRCLATDSCEAPPACQNQGDPCPLSNLVASEEQGGFFCVRLAQDAPPSCVAKCEQTFSPDKCPAQSFCLEVNLEDTPAAVCLPSECQAHGDCTFLGPDGGTCVPFGNQASFCFSAGQASRGSFCGGEIGCAPGLFCTNSGGLLGSTCQPLCDMWAREDACGRDAACAFLTLGTGVCRPPTEQGRDIGDPCSPEGGWCDDGVQCYDLQTGGDPNPTCVAWCRPGTEDCRGRLQNHDGFCRAVFAGPGGTPIQDFGLCL